MSALEVAPLPDWYAKWPDGRLNGMFDCKPQPATWFIRDRILAGRAHLIAGVGGSSKTRLQYHLAVGAVLGRLPWDWEVAQTGSAALFLAEDTIDDSHRVLHAIGATLGEEDHRKLVRHLRVFQLAGFGFRLLSLDGQTLVETNAYEWMRRQIEMLPAPAVYIGIDPALGVTEGDEMSATHQRRLGEMVDKLAIETGASSVLTTHSAKATFQADELGSHASRGSGAITDAVRGEFALRTMTLEEARKFGIDDIVERKRYVQLAATKGNSLPPEAYAPVWLRRGDAGLLSGVSLEQVERGSVGQRELQALEILKASCVSGATALKFWRAQCEAASLVAGSDSAKEKAMQRIVSALVAAGLVVKDTTHRGLFLPA